MKAYCPDLVLKDVADLSFASRCCLTTYFFHIILFSKKFFLTARGRTKTKTKSFFGIQVESTQFNTMLQIEILYYKSKMKLRGRDVNARKMKQ